MKKILYVAWREFSTTAMTKAFILGAFVVPVVLGVIMVFGFKYLFKDRTPETVGQLAVIDRTGRVADDVAEHLRPESIMARNRELVAEVAEAIDESVGSVAPGVAESVKASAEAEIRRVPRISVETLASSADPEAEKEPLKQGKAAEGGRLALAIIAEDAVGPPAGSGKYGGFELFIRAKLDDRVEEEIRNAVSEGIRKERIRAANLDPQVLDALIDVHGAPTKEVSAAGERDSLAAARMFVPVGFMIVLMVSVMMGGQYLLTTTVEEKASRVVEVLLSALSPMELMTGKILGQLGVGVVILVIYGGLGGGALVLWGLGYLLGVVNLLYLLVFFAIAYFTIGAMMAAVGSAVNDLREAQSLQTPVMLSVFIPYLLWLPISRDPNSLFATVLSFLPPILPFVMMLRLTSSEPPPAWQVALSIAIGSAGVYAAIWAAAKIFRIGLLMFGKPPNFRTLIKWVRMA